MTKHSEHTCWVVMPVFNEASGILNWMREIEQALLGQTVSFVLSDDGSSDGLKDVLKGRTNQTNYIVLGDGTNRGPGAAFQTAFHHVMQQGQPGDTVVTLESDGTADLSSLSAMFEALKRSDIVLASVYLPGGRFTQTSATRLLLSHAANALTRSVLRMPYRTLTSFYRAYRIEALHAIQKDYLPLISETGFICQVELLWKAQRCGLRIVEVSTCVFAEKRIGKSKMKINRTIKEYTRFMWKVIYRKFTA